MNIRIRIDVTKISKDKLYKGEKGTYLNATLVETPDSQYNDYVIIEEVSKSEREQGIKGTILGNGSNIRPKEHATDHPAYTPTVQPAQEQPTNDLPF